MPVVRSHESTVYNDIYTWTKEEFLAVLGISLEPGDKVSLVLFGDNSFLANVIRVQEKNKLP